jgi:GGDEF domain-containing protein
VSALIRPSYGPAQAVVRAYDALIRFAESDDALADPLLVVAYDILAAADEPVDNRALLQHMARARARYGRENPRRYRWGLGFRAAAISAAYRREDSVGAAHWRPREHAWLAEQPSAYGARLMMPITLAAQFGYWGRVIADDGTEPEIAAFAAALLDESLPTAEHDVASMQTAIDPWRDTFALWVLSGEPETADRLRDLLFALATRYGSIAARSGVVCGVRHPWFERPLVSATAQLGAGLWHWGVYPSLLPALISFVSLSRTADAAWADEGQPTDVLTTLAAADLLSTLDPGFDPEPTAAWLMDRQETAGWWRALDPETPWLTAAIARWLLRSERSFTDRFSWPSTPVWTRDRMTGLTTLAGIDELIAAMGALPRLNNETMEVAFLDLAGFRAFNKIYASQEEGDRVLRLLGGALDVIPGVLAARIGGDEMLLLGKPGNAIGSVIEAWRAAWPARLRAAGIEEKVAPRILIGRSAVRDVSRLRRELGEGIFRMKQQYPETPAEGVQARLMDGLIG